MTEYASNLNSKIPHCDVPRDGAAGNNGGAAGNNGDADGVSFLGRINNPFEAHLHQEQRSYDLNDNHMDNPILDMAGRTYESYVGQMRPYVPNRGTRLSPNRVCVQDLFGQMFSSSHKDGQHDIRPDHDSVHSTGRHGDIMMHSGGRRGGEMFYSSGRQDGLSDRWKGGRIGPYFGDERGDGLAHVSGRDSGGLGHQPLFGRHDREKDGPRYGVSHDVSKPQASSHKNGQGVVFMRDGVSKSIHDERLWCGQGTSSDIPSGDDREDVFVKHERDSWGKDMRLGGRCKTELDHHVLDESNEFDSVVLNSRHPMDHNSFEASVLGISEPSRRILEKSPFKLPFSGNSPRRPASNGGNKLSDHNFSGRSSPEVVEPSPDLDGHQSHLGKHKQGISLNPIIKKHCKLNIQQRKPEQFKNDGYSLHTSFRSRMGQPSKLAVQERLGPQPDDKDLVPLDLQARLGPSVSNQDLRLQLNNKAESPFGTDRFLGKLANSDDKHLAGRDRSTSTRQFPSSDDLLQSLSNFRRSLGATDDVLKLSSAQGVSYHNHSPQLSGLVMSTSPRPADGNFKLSPSVTINSSSVPPDNIRNDCHLFQHSAVGNLSSVSPVNECSSKEERSHDRHLIHSPPEVERSTGVATDLQESAVHPSLNVQCINDKVVSVVSDAKTTARQEAKVQTDGKSQAGSALLHGTEAGSQSTSFNQSTEVTKTMMKVISALKNDPKVVARVEADVGTSTTSVEAPVNNKRKQKHRLSSKTNLSHVRKGNQLRFGLHELYAGSDNKEQTSAVPPGHVEAVKIPLLCTPHPSLRNSLQSSDSEQSECDLVIDLNHVSETPCRRRNTDPLPITSTTAVEISRGDEQTIRDEKTCECMAKEELGSSLVNQLLKCKPSPLHELYHSIEAIIDTIHQCRCPSATVLQAFWSYAISKPDTKQPFTLPHLFRAELASLHRKCLNDLNKWNMQIRMFILLLSTLPERKNCKMISSEESLAKPSVDVSHAVGETPPHPACGPGSSGKTVACQGPSMVAEKSREKGVVKPINEVVKPINEVVKPINEVSPVSPAISQHALPFSSLDSPSAEVGSSLGLNCSASVCSDASEGGECNMSVCSTVSDDVLECVRPELVGVPVCSSETKTDCLVLAKDLLKEEDHCQRRDRLPSLSSGELTPSPPCSPAESGKLSTFSPSNSFKQDTPSCGVKNRDISLWPLEKYDQEKKMQFSHYSGSYYESSSARTHPSSDKDLHTSLSSDIRSSSYRRRQSGSREKTILKETRPTNVRPQRMTSPKSLSRQRTSDSPSPRSHAFHSRKDRRLRSPYFRKRINSSSDRQQRMSLSKEEEDEDMELLKLKKEVILSIVQKPAVRRSETKVGNVDTKFREVNTKVDMADNAGNIDTKVKMADAKIAGVDIEVRTANTKVEEVDTTVLMADTKIIDTKFGKVNTEVKTADTKVVEVNTKVKAANTMVKTANTKVKTVNTKVGQDNTKVGEDNTKVKTANTKVKTASTKVKTASTKVKTASTKVGEVNIKVETAKTKVEDVNTKVKMANTKDGEVNTKGKLIDTKVGKVKTKVKANVTKVKMANTKVEETSNKIGGTSVIISGSKTPKTVEKASSRQGKFAPLGSNVSVGSAARLKQCNTCVSVSTPTAITAVPVSITSQPEALKKLLEYVAFRSSSVHSSKFKKKAQSSTMSTASCLTVHPHKKKTKLSPTSARTGSLGCSSPAVIKDPLPCINLAILGSNKGKSTPTRKSKLSPTASHGRSSGSRSPVIPSMEAQQKMRTQGRQDGRPAPSAGTSCDRSMSVMVCASVL